ncbi:MAG: tryptophan synthase subunit beta [Candidatus Nanopelagicales bacterium]
MDLPDASGHFGRYGGRFVPEALVAALDELDDAFRKAWVDDAFHAELDTLLHEYSGRPTPLTPAAGLAKAFGVAEVLLKREDLNHTGSHKINNVLGQALLTKRMGKTRVIAETGAGQHGVATATAAALLGLECVVYMGEEDTQRQSLNVARMQLLGAKVVPVTTGSRTLKDAINEAMRDWVTNVASTHYLLGTVAGPAPFPEMVREFHRVIGKETRQQMPGSAAGCPTQSSPASAVAPTPSASSTTSSTMPTSVSTDTRRQVTASAPDVTPQPCRPVRSAFCTATRSYLLQDDDGQTMASHSISAGLDYPGVGPEHAWLRDSGRVHYEGVTDAEAMAAFELCCRTEGIIPAIESAHAVAGAQRLAKQLGPEASIVINMSGRGDKDVATAAAYFGLGDV